MNKLKLVFCGTPACALPVLDFLKKSSLVDLQLVVSMPDRPAGRGKKLCSPPVAQFAKDNQIELLQTPNVNKDPEFLNFLSSHSIDAIIVFAFAQFLGSKILKATPRGCFNIHTSLLPKYRGAAPIQYALLNGDNFTGVSIQKMVKQMDAGDIAASKKIEIDGKDDAPSLTCKLEQLTVELLPHFLEDLSNNTLRFTSQNQNDISFAPTIKKDLGHIEFTKLTCNEINNRCRALTPWPGLYFFLNGKRVKIIALNPSDMSLDPGEVSTRYDMLTIGCREGAVHLCQLQVEGKKCCCDRDFINGFRSSIPKEIS